MKKYIFIVFFLITGQAWGATYYVKNGGNDSLSGLDDANAWETISKVTATATNGDTVYFRSQDTWTGTVPLLVTVAGVTYDGSTYGSGTKATLTPTNGNNAVGIVRMPGNGSTLKGFNINGADFVNNGIDICGRDSTCDKDITNITVDGCDVHHIGGTTSLGDPQNWDNVGRGIYIGTFNAGRTISNVTIKNTKVYNVNHTGIAIYPTWHQDVAIYRVTNPIVRNCEVYNTGLAGDIGFGSGIHLKDDVVSPVIEFSYVHDSPTCLAHETDGNYPSTSGAPQNLVFRYNICKGTTLAVNFGNAGNQTITGDFYGNLFVNNATDLTIALHDYGTSVLNFYNNTFYNSTGTGNNVYSIRALEGNPGYPYGTPIFNFKNNIIYTVNQVPLAVCVNLDTNSTNCDPSLFVHSNNLIYRSSGASAIHVLFNEYVSTQTTWDRNGGTSDLKTGTSPWETTAKKTDPTFTGGTLPTGFSGTYGVNMVPNTTYFAIASGDAIGNGATLGSPYNSAINYAGVATPLTRPAGAYDIGAYQLTGVGAYPPVSGGLFRGGLLIQ